MDRMRKSLLQKGRCSKYEEDRERENGSKRECSKKGKKDEKAVLYHL